MMSMGRGIHMCIGINLANAEMRLVLAAVAQYDLELFETNEEDTRFSMTIMSRLRSWTRKAYELEHCKANGLFVHVKTHWPGRCDPLYLQKILGWSPRCCDRTLHCPSPLGGYAAALFVVSCFPRH